MKSDILFANTKVVTQDINNKLSDTSNCLQLFNRFYAAQKSAMTDIFVDSSKKAPGVPDQLQVWNQEDFGGVVRAIDAFIDETREDNLTCTQLLLDLRDRVDLNRVKTTLLTMAKKFGPGGIHTQMDDTWINWIRGLSFSLQTWSNIFGQRLAKAVGLFDDITELLFLSDRVFPFILENVRKLAQESKYDAKAEEKAADWKDLSSFLKGLDIRLNHLQARLAPKWAEGSKVVEEMLARSTKLKKVVVFLWGEVSAKRVYSNLNREIAELIGVVSRMHLDKNYRYDKNILATIAEKVFTLVEDFGSHENHFLKYKTLDVPSIKEKVIGLRDAYEKLCMRLASFTDDENLTRSKNAADNKQKITTPSGIVGKQATQPELNDAFIRNGILQ